jgi:sugar phosphate isomerase/epimerase
VELAGKYGIQVGYHNHPNYIGASIWDMTSVIEPLDPRWCGYYFDLGHICVDSGEDEWKIAANLVIPRLKMIAVKDLTWQQGGRRQWEAVTCPLGKGMAPWKEFLSVLAKSDFHGPITLHEEFAIPGVADEQGIALSREAVPQVMAAAKQNLDYLKSVLREAYEGT